MKFQTNNAHGKASSLRTTTTTTLPTVSTTKLKDRKTIFGWSSSSIFLVVVVIMCLLTEEPRIRQANASTAAASQRKGAAAAYRKKSSLSLSTSSSSTSSSTSSESVVQEVETTVPESIAKNELHSTPSQSLSSASASAAATTALHNKQGGYYLFRQFHPQQYLDPKAKLQRGTRLGMMSLALLLLAYSLTIPHLQSHYDSLGCDSLCQGSLSSTRSFLKLLGATLMGKLSDGAIRATDHKSGSTTQSLQHSRTRARRLALFIGLASASASLWLAFQAKTTTQLWYALLPSALEQNISIFRAVVSDYQQNVPTQQLTASERAKAAGSLGFAMGLALMIGPILGSWLPFGLCSNFKQATYFALFILAGSALTVYLLPDADTVPSAVAVVNQTPVKSKDDKTSTPLTKSSGITSRFWNTIMNVPSLRSSAGIFFLMTRFVSTMAFQMFQTITFVSLRQRFEFGPKEYGLFFSMNGFCFAMSQGPIASWVVHHFCQNDAARARVVTFCAFFVGALRYLAIKDCSALGRNAAVAIVYVVFGLLTASFGVLATILQADTSHWVQPSEAGAFYGVIASIESSAGMIGPILGGLLSKLQVPASLSMFLPSTASFQLPLLAVLLLSGLNVMQFWTGYEPFVLKHQYHGTTTTTEPTSPLVNEQQTDAEKMAKKTL